MTALLDKALDAAIAPGFSSIGYNLRSKAWEPIEVSLDGRTAIVTGATSGLGKATANQLASLGARTILVGRDKEKTDIVARAIASETGNDEIDVEIADLSLMSETRALAHRLLARDEPIHILVNNAGALFPERSETQEGVERTLATNLLSHFLLTNLLIPRMIDSAPARIVNVSSGGMYGQRISVTNLQSDQGEYKGSAAYARSKRGQVILTEMWADQLDGTGVTVNAMHPGWADTPGVRDSLPGFYRLTKPFLRSPDQGADTIVWLAASPQVEDQTGRFWHDRAPRPVHKTKRTRERAEARDRLWDRLARLSGWNQAS